MIHTPVLIDQLTHRGGSRWSDEFHVCGNHNIPATRPNLFET